MENNTSLGHDTIESYKSTYTETSKSAPDLDFVLSSVFVITSLLRRDGVGVATTEDWIAG